MESAQRGFLIDDRRYYSESYEEAKARIGKEVKLLKNLTYDNVHQRKRAGDLQILLKDKINHMDTMIRLEKGKDLEAAKELFALGKGASLKERISKVTDSMEQEEKQLLEVRAQKAKRFGLLLYFLIPFGTLLIFGCVLYSANSINKTLKILEETEKKLQQARDSALGSSRLKSDFLANMSHEIRTPLNGIIGMTDLLAESDLAPSQKRYAELAKSSANSLLTVINDILDFSKIEAGKLSLEVVDFTLVSVVENAVEILVSKAREKKLTLMSFIDPQLPENLRGDPGRLSQVLLNLTSNAIKFTEKGGVLVQALAGQIVEDKVWVSFSVSDTGVGISKEAQNRLFQPFIQADSSMARKYGGTGLGLSICRSLVNLMEGEITLKSEPGEGSTFTFQLPFEMSNAPSLAESSLPDLKNLKILVIDDDPLSCDILKKYILSWGMQVESTNTGVEALRMLLQAAKDGNPYDIAIIDLFIPEMDGFEIAAMIDSEESLVKLRKISVTAYDSLLGERRLKESFNAYLTKPIKQSYLFDAIVHLVNSNYCELDSPLSSGQQIQEFKTSVKNLDERNSEVERDKEKELILIVEDNQVNQMLAGMHLEKLNYAYHVVSNGREALEAVSDVEYDLVLMDCQMPEMDGYQATRAIRKVESLCYGKRLPIIAMTANAMKGDEEKCLAAGMDDYLSKPVDKNKLAEKLRKWLKAKKENVKQENSVIDSVSLEDQVLLLEAYLGVLDKSVSSMRLAYQKSDLEQLSKEAHSLKSSSMAVGASALGQICQKLERHETNNIDNGQLEALIKTLESEAVKTRKVLEEKIG